MGYHKIPEEVHNLNYFLKSMCRLCKYEIIIEINSKKRMSLSKNTSEVLMNKFNAKYYETGLAIFSR
jgi:hypothetical protein